MNQITSRIFISAISQVPELVAKHDIHSVCSILAYEGEMNYLKDLSPKGVVAPNHLWIPHGDGDEFYPGEIAKFLEWMDQAVRLGKVLVHCGAGISRSPSLVIAHLIAVGFDWDQALDIVQRRKPIAFPHPALKRSILRFFRDLCPPPVASGNPA